MTKQIKSNQRVADHGEVLTAKTSTLSSWNISFFTKVDVLELFIGK